MQGARGGRVDEDAKILVLHPVTIVEPIITDSEIFLSQMLLLAFCFQVHGGATHSDVAKSYHNIGSVYYRQGKYEEALVQYQKALAIDLAVHGQDHPSVADSYKNIGVVYGSQGNMSAATEMYIKAYHMYLQVLGPDHPSTQGLKPFV